MRPDDIRSGLRSLSPQTKYAILATIAGAVCLLFGFLYAPQLYPVDFGRYSQILSETGLSWTAEDLAQGELSYTRPITHFAYGEFSWFRLLSPKAGNSIIYPIALVRLFTEPFGLRFSVDALAFVLSCILLACVFLQTKYLFTCLPKYAAFPITGLCVLFTDSNFCAMLRAIYPQGMMIVCTVLYITALSGYFASTEKKRPVHLLTVAITTILLLRSSSHMIVFLPAFLLMGGFLIVRERRLLMQHLTGAVLTLVITAAFLTHAFTAIANDPDVVSNAATYSNVFATLLPSSKNPSVVIREFGLDESYLRDIGLSYYDKNVSFAHDPQDEEEAKILFSKITVPRIVRSYLRHPIILSRAGNAYPYTAGSYESLQNATLKRSNENFSEYRNPAGIAGILRSIFHPDYYSFRILILFFSLYAVYMGIFKKKRIWLFADAFAICACLYLPFVTICSGYYAGVSPILYQVFLQDLLFPVLLCILLKISAEFKCFMLRCSAFPIPGQDGAVPITEGAAAGRRSEKTKSKAPSFGQKLLPFFQKAGNRIGTFFASANRAALFFTALSVLMICMVFLPSAHAATVNNGDYGRMMMQLDLTWTEDLMYNSEQCSLHQAIENYVYTDSFDPLKLTPFKPTYTLYFFASIVRLLTEPFGQLFNTRLLAFIMSLTVAMCIGMIVRDLYPHCGKWSCLAGCILCAILMSETYLCWFNSLFGEGTIIVGLVLTIMCTIHLLAARPKKLPFTILWLLGQALSLGILCGAKSQMLLAAPGACLLFFFTALCCRPSRKLFRVLWDLASAGLCIVLVIAAIGIYHSDRDESSVSQRHTMWQAYFYGIFMISDDPIADMNELGIDTAMAADIGKYVKFGEGTDEMYVYAPFSEEAQSAFHDHVNMGTILSWYLRHPSKLLYMLNHAASESKELYTGFRVYTGEDYSEPDHRKVDGFDLWPSWRSSFAPGSFIGYVILYLLILIASLRLMRKRDLAMPIRLLPSLGIFLMLTGALQFPLSVLGNGFADNHKQLFAFSLCHDLLLGMCICYLVYQLNRIRKKTPGTDNDRIPDRNESKE